VSGASLGLFRVCVGFLFVLESISLLRPSQSSAGRIPLEVYYTGRDITFHFPYPWMEWLPFLPPAGIHAVVAILGISGLLLAAGWAYRWSATAVFLSWGYLYAIESTRTYWMSYHYLELLTAFLLMGMPADRRFRLPCPWRRPKGPAEGSSPGATASAQDSGVIANGHLVVLRGQLVIAYFYAGLAKVNSDWLLEAMPVRQYLERSKALAMGLPESWVLSDALAYFLSWSGAAFDLAVGFLLLIRRSRLLGLALLLAFHTTNHFFLFDDIGWFPLLGATTALIFLDPDWPDRVRQWWNRPTWASPDRRWLSLGAVALPGIGALLGWKLRPSSPPDAASRRMSGSGQWLPWAVTGWLIFQTVVPLRHFVIPGDGRFTWEGIPFSWRLKTEVYRAGPIEVGIRDSSIIRSLPGTWAADGASPVWAELDWDEWPGEAVLYRSVDPRQVPWEMLPEMVVLWDSILGERVLYNPHASPDRPRTEQEAVERIHELWLMEFGRIPAQIRPTLPLSQILDGYVTAMRQKGIVLPPGSDVLAALHRVHGAGGNGQMLPMLRRMHPFALQHDPPIAAPFLWVDDPALSSDSPQRPQTIDRELWTRTAFHRGRVDASLRHKGADPMVLYSADIRMETHDFLPKAILVQNVLPHPMAQEPVTGPVGTSPIGFALGPVPYVRWNVLKDAQVSKVMHFSTQPFLLRRYAVRVADLWAEATGRFPAVHASTQVSLNRRPLQALVDPEADLASVTVRWLRRNPWILDLEPR
jgi:vitamin K-dependent gamma-carboxylase